jgi:4-hydroxy-3-methylbut-2-enyl diphosphate reductase IspH
MPPPSSTVSSIARSLQSLRQGSANLNLSAQATRSTAAWMDKVEKHFLEPASAASACEAAEKRDKALKKLVTLMRNVDEHEVSVS